jgi:hypothetical protein
MFNLQSRKKDIKNAWVGRLLSGGLFYTSCASSHWSHRLGMDENVNALYVSAMNNAT